MTELEVTPALLTADEAGRLLNLPPRWLLREARANRVPHVRFGRYVRFDQDELHRWWRARIQGPASSTLA